MSSTKSSTTKPRIQRLRASCDGCFLAKVKCSKARPICSRCLTCGTDCKYSPSSRAGKPKANRQNNISNMSLNIVSPGTTTDSGLSSPFIFESHAISMAADRKNSPIFTLNTNWSVASNSADESFPGSISSTTTPSVGDENIFDGDMCFPPGTNELFDPSFAWTADSQAELESAMFQFDPGMTLPRSKSVGDVAQLNSFSPWFEGQQNNAHLSPHSNTHSLSPTTFDSPCSSPGFSGPARTPSSPCNCFTLLLQCLHSLHNHSNSSKAQPAFDVVLTINRKAIEGCASMLACSNCAANTGSNTTAMLLATIMEKVLSFYQAAIHSYIGPKPGTDSQMSIGTYQVTNEDGCWLKAEILWRELGKLEELLGHFQNVCGVQGGVQGTGVHSSLATHLSRSLHFTFEVMKLQQIGLGNLE